MNAGTRRDAIELAKTRWAAIHSFDLDPATWDHLFNQYPAGNILQAIRMTLGTKDPVPERRFKRFEQMLIRISQPYNTQF